MKIAVGFPAPLHIGIQPVIVHNLKFSFLRSQKANSYTYRAVKKQSYQRRQARAKCLTFNGTQG